MSQPILSFCLFSRFNEKEIGGRIRLKLAQFESSMTVSETFVEGGTDCP